MEKKRKRRKKGVSVKTLSRRVLYLFVGIFLGFFPLHYIFIGGLDDSPKSQQQQEEVDR